MQRSKQQPRSRDRRQAGNGCRQRGAQLVALALGIFALSAGSAAAEPIDGNAVLASMRAIGSSAISTIAPEVDTGADVGSVENVGDEHLGVKVLKSVYAVVGMPGSTLDNLVTRPATERVSIGFQYVVKF